MKFCDGLDRKFVPYKGWMKVNKDGSLTRDELTVTEEGPFNIVIDTESHGSWHTLYNLASPNGEKMLKKGVRKIRYYPLGYYLIEDNNEDELINRGDVKGGFRRKDYQEWYSIITDDGKIDNSETLINSLRMLKHRGFVGRFNICRYVIEDGRWIENEINNQNQSEYTAAMWADHGIWGMNVIDETGYRHYSFGQGDLMINYAHEVLINCSGAIFLEKDGTWFLRLLGGKTIPCFYLREK